MSKEISTKTLIIIATIFIIAGIVLGVFVSMSTGSISEKAGFEEVTVGEEEPSGSTGQVSLGIIEPPKDTESVE